MNFKLTNRICFGLANILVFLLVYLNKENGFFWDTIQLASQHGNFYYTNDFSELLLPMYLDSGHIPAFGMYIAMIWKIFGKTLIASHLAMLPFAFGIVWQLYALCKRFISEKFVGLALILILIDATLMSQMTLVSPDVPLVFFFLLAVNSVFNNRKALIAISVFFMFLISMRGMMISVCLVFLDVYVNYGFRKNITKDYMVLICKRAVLYLPALLLFLAFSFYHFQEKGWIGYHKDSPWADCFEKVGFEGFLRNIGFLGWRLLDFGRVGVWIVFMWLFLKYRQRLFKNRQNHSVYFLYLVLIVLLPLNMLWAKNLMGHRYLLPIFLSFSLVTASVLFSDYVSNKLRYTLISIWFVVSLTGNLWIYPPKISKGADATLAHLPYYKLRLQMLDFIDKHNMDYKSIQTFFPNYYALDDIDLNKDKRHFDNYTLGNGSPYIFYSNIFNVKDETYDYFIENYTEVQRFENNGIYVVLFKKNHP